jgi:hypothetical protein
VFSLAFVGLASAAGDVTPGALNWANITGVAPDGSNANQTISGIDVPIVLHLDLTVSAGTGTMKYDKNDGANVAFVDNDTVQVSAGNTLSFTATYGSGAQFSGTVSVKNASDGMTELDSFTFLMTGS